MVSTSSSVPSARSLYFLVLLSHLAAHPSPITVPIPSFSCHRSSPGKRDTAVHWFWGVASPHCPRARLKQATDRWQRRDGSQAPPAVIKPSQAPRRIQPGGHIPRDDLNCPLSGAARVRPGLTRASQKRVCATENRSATVCRLQTLGALGASTKQPPCPRVGESWQLPS